MIRYNNLKKDIGNAFKLQDESNTYRCNIYDSQCRYFFHGQTSVQQPFYPVPDLANEVIPNAMSNLPKFIDTSYFPKYFPEGY